MVGEPWTDENKVRLLNCQDDFEMQCAFPEHNLESLKRRRREFGGNKLATARIGKLADLLEKSGIAVEEIGNVQKVSLREWQVMHKDENGEAVVTDLEGAGIVLTPEWASGPKWQTIQQAPPKVVYPYAMPPRVVSRTKTAVVMPDMQVGFRRDRYTDMYDPFHDEMAMNLVLQVLDALPQVDAVFNIGDGLDNAEFGRFVQEPAFANTSQKSINYLSDFLAQVTALTPHAERKFLEGNHDRRIENYLVKNAEKAYGIQRANRPDEWPVLSVPYLTRMDEIGWEYVPGYPANIAWINERVSVVHGEKVRSAGSTASAVIDDERVSTIFGHVHRIEKQHKTMRTFNGAKSNFAASIGCLCRTDGAVPSMKGSTDPYGRPIQRSENWQQGFAVVTYEEGDGFFDMEQISIHNGRAFFRGNQYKS